MANFVLLYSGGSAGATDAERGKVMEAWATGYSILKADSLNAAVDLAKGCPVLQSGGKITVYEITPAM